ncbi:MAG: SDR family oxidoreductase [Blautia sp.]|nr:SDR family oxidoreductase [Blautia sp.]
MKQTYAVITGASSGIGAEFARRLAKEGYRLFLVARRKERLLECADMLAETECEVFAADLSREEECRRLMQALADKKIGVFINNAGFGDCGSFLETEVEKELQMIDVNVRAVHLLTKLVLQKMQAQGGGYLLNVASSAGLIPAGPYMATYYATKAYVASLTRAVAQELKEQGSKVYLGALCPGPVDTEFNNVANVEFALPGISAERCVDCAIEGMKRRKTLIVPTATMQISTSLGRFLPQSVYIRLAGHQQKKKLEAQ